MNFKDRINEAKELERLSQIVLNEGQRYEGIIISASYGKQAETNYDKVELKVKLTQEEVGGKIVTKNFIIDEKTKNPLQGTIGLQQLLKLLEQFNIQFEDEKGLVIGLLDLKEQKVFVELKKSMDKNSGKVFNNYTISKA